MITKCNLVVRYLYAIEDGAGGLIPKVFTKCECLYLILTSLLKQEEIKFYEQSLVNGFESYAKEEWPYLQAYLSWRFSHVNYALVPHPIHYHLKLAKVRDLELSSAHAYSSYTFHDSKAFRAHHSKNEQLTLDCYQRINSRRMPTRVHSSYHLYWILEYSNACTLCQ